MSERRVAEKERKKEQKLKRQWIKVRKICGREPKGNKRKSSEGRYKRGGTVIKGTEQSVREGG